MGIDPNTISIARGMAFGIMTTIMLGSLALQIHLQALLLAYLPYWLQKLID
jgi:hypothetical protein